MIDRLPITKETTIGQIKIFLEARKVPICGQNCCDSDTSGEIHLVEGVLDVGVILNDGLACVWDELDDDEVRFTERATLESLAKLAAKRVDAVRVDVCADTDF